nr:MAG TPA: hypothetical protein [Caudoviricetes sp.]
MFRREGLFSWINTPTRNLCALKRLTTSRLAGEMQKNKTVIFPLLHK